MAVVGELYEYRPDSFAQVLQVDSFTTGEAVAAPAATFRVAVLSFQAIKAAAGTSNLIMRTDGASGDVVFYGSASDGAAGVDPTRHAGGKVLFECAAGENCYFSGTSVTISALRYALIPI